MATRINRFVARCSETSHIAHMLGILRSVRLALDSARRSNWHF